MTTETTIELDAFVGKWHGLISTTNWEKGRIIFEWREALRAAQAPSSEYRDEAWSALVGAVTPQHVGRLRRVFERFHDVQASYEGLYWSHFHAAIDWDDAEMWLEGAVQNGWSISQMRRQRWETLGSIPELEPREDQIFASEVDEDVQVLDRGELDFAGSISNEAIAVSADDENVAISVHAVEPVEPASKSRRKDEREDKKEREETAELVEAKAAMPRYFADLPELPDDLAEAIESLKLAIIKHRMANWEEVSHDAIAVHLKALTKFAMAE